MIKFSDVCKAYIRYWFVILICVVLAFCTVLIVSPKTDTYTATSTIYVKNSDGTQASTTTADTTISTTNKIISNTAFYADVVKRIANTDSKLAKKLNATDKIKNNMQVHHEKNAIFFTVSFTLNDEAEARSVANIISEKIISDHNARPDSATKLEYLTYTDVTSTPSKIGIYSVIGILIGLVLGVVLVTFFVVFNPFVENKELLMKETDTNILGSIPKKNGDKDIDNLATNIELIMKDNKQKYLAFTSDAKLDNVVSVVDNIANIYKEDKKVLVVGYSDIDIKADNVDFKVISKNDDKESIDALGEPYDMVLGICPNMIESKYYLHMSSIMQEMVIVAKTWDSKTQNILAMKNMVKDKDVDLLGLIYKA